MVDVPPWKFDLLVRDAVASLPRELPAALADVLDNVAVQIRDFDPEEPELLGLYEGVPLTEWGDAGHRPPAVVFVYRQPLCDMCESEEELIEQVRITVIHEVAHHVGIDDDRLEELGWD